MACSMIDLCCTDSVFGHSSFLTCKVMEGSNSIVNSSIGSNHGPTLSSIEQESSKDEGMAAGGGGGRPPGRRQSLVVRVPSASTVEVHEVPSLDSSLGAGSVPHLPYSASASTLLPLQLVLSPSRSPQSQQQQQQQQQRQQHPAAAHSRNRTDSTPTPRPTARSKAKQHERYATAHEGQLKRHHSASILKPPGRVWPDKKRFGLKHRLRHMVAAAKWSSSAAASPLHTNNPSRTSSPSASNTSRRRRRRAMLALKPASVARNATPSNQRSPGGWMQSLRSPAGSTRRSYSQLTVEAHSKATTQRTPATVAAHALEVAKHLGGSRRGGLDLTPRATSAPEPKPAADSAPAGESSGAQRETSTRVWGALRSLLTHTSAFEAAQRQFMRKPKAAATTTAAAAAAAPTQAQGSSPQTQSNGEATAVSAFAMPFHIPKLRNRLAHAMNERSAAVRALEIQRRRAEAVARAQGKRGKRRRGGKGGANKDLREQGNTDLYSLANMTKRMQLRSSTAVLTRILRLWEMVNPPLAAGRAAKPTITFRQYQRLMVIITRHLQPSLGRQEINFMVRQDWATDSKGAKGMTPVQFAASLFELTDTWCQGVEAHEYTEFLEDLVQAAKRRGLGAEPQEDTTGSDSDYSLSSAQESYTSSSSGSVTCTSEEAEEPEEEEAKHPPSAPAPARKQRAPKRQPIGPVIVAPVQHHKKHGKQKRGLPPRRRRRSTTGQAPSFVTRRSKVDGSLPKSEGKAVSHCSHMLLCLVTHR